MIYLPVSVSIFSKVPAGGMYYTPFKEPRRREKNSQTGEKIQHVSELTAGKRQKKKGKKGKKRRKKREN